MRGLRQRILDELDKGTVTQMYEDLVKRLRTSQTLAEFVAEETAKMPNTIFGEAADAIETLIGKVKYLIERCDMADKNCAEAVHLGALWKEAALERMPRWIPVEERLPTGGDDSGAICENVCLLLDDGTVSCGWMNGITKKVYYLNARDDVVIKAPITRVTHWMPLPEPPKEETE